MSQRLRTAPEGTPRDVREIEIATEVDRRNPGQPDAGRRRRRCAWLGASALGVALLLGAAGARGADPVRVPAEGVVAITDSTESSLTRLALEAASREAVYQLALDLVPSDRLLTREEELRDALAPRAAGLVTQFVQEGKERRPSLEDPLQQEYVERFSLTVDRERLRAFLRELGWIQRGPARPAVVLRVLAADGLRSSAVLEFERFLEGALREQGYPLVEPSLFPGPSGERGRESAAELGRRLGADVAVDVTVRSQALPARDAGSVGGVRAEVTVSAVLVADVTELAIGRHEAPGIARDRGQALSTALQGVQGQVAQSLLFQLDRNMAALQTAPTALRLRLAGVTSLLQVELVQRALVERLGVRSAQLALMEPRGAELVIQGPLSAGVLQERLAGLVFDGFQLQVQGVEPSQVSMRVLTLDFPRGAPPADRQGRAPQIDTRNADG